MSRTGPSILVGLAALTGVLDAGPLGGAPRATDPCASVRGDTLALDLTFDVDRSDTATPVGLALRLPPMRDTSLILALPSSDAGRSRLYENIVDLHVVSPGAQLIQTDRPDHRQLVARPGEPVYISWRLRATARSYASDDAHNHSDIGPDWAQIVGYDALILPALGGAKTVCTTLRFHGLQTGAAVGTSFGPLGPDSTIAMRGSLSDLRHAVYVLSTKPSAIHAYATTVSGGSLTVLIRGRHAIDDSTLVARVKQVMTEERRFWGTTPPPHYLVTIGVAPQGSLDGVRLVNAFVADIDSTQKMNEWVQGLFAHELMHEWIGSGILHPSAAVPDGALYWFTEGFDDFLAHRLMHAVGLLSDTGYVHVVNRDLMDHAFSAGRDSSWEALRRHGTLEEEPYARGELIALALNAEIARESRGRITLDSLLRGSIRRPPAQLANGLTAELIYHELGATIGADTVRSIVERMLAGGPIALPNDALGPCMTSAMVEHARWDPGFDFDASIRYLPTGQTVTVQRWSLSPGCIGPASQFR